MRFGVLFAGNGFHRDHWWAKGAGADMELGQVLAPLAGFREKLLFVRGLYNEEALKGNIHSSQTGNLLSGAPIASGGEVRSGTSIDQVLAQTYGRQTKVPSLVLACEKANPSVHKNYSMLYSSHISWSSPTTPTPLELYPALAFDRLFRDDAGRGDKSVLDAVLANRGEVVYVEIADADRHDFDDRAREIELAATPDDRTAAIADGGQPRARDRPAPAEREGDAGALHRSGDCFQRVGFQQHLVSSP